MTRTAILALSISCCGLLVCSASCGDGGGGDGDPPIECAQEDAWVVWEQCCEAWGEFEEGGGSCHVANEDETLTGFCICFLGHDCTQPPGCEGYTDTDVDTDIDTDTDTDAVDCEC